MERNRPSSFEVSAPTVLLQTVKKSTRTNVAKTLTEDIHHMQNADSEKYECDLSNAQYYDTEYEMKKKNDSLCSSFELNSKSEISYFHRGVVDVCH